MKTHRYFLICILLLYVLADRPAVQAQSESAPSDSQTVLRVMCYNIRHGRGMDDVVDLTRTANAIKAWNPDVVAVQEVDRNTARTNRTDQPKILAEKLGMHYAFGKAIDHQGGDYGLLILSRFPILDHQMILLPQEGQREQRGLQIARIGIPDATGKIIRLANTHLGLSQTEREAQFDKIKVLLSEGDEPVILAGDFNVRPNNPLVVNLLETWKDADDPALGKNVTPNVQSRFGRIDYIFFRADDPFEVLESGTINDSITSDHMPIFSIFAL